MFVVVALVDVVVVVVVVAIMVMGFGGFGCAGCGGSCVGGGDCVSTTFKLHLPRDCVAVEVD